MAIGSGVTAQWVRDTFLQGIPFEDKNGKPFPHKNLDLAISAVMKEWTREYGVLWEPTRVVAGEVLPDKYPATPEPLLRVTGPSYDPQMWNGDKWAILKLSHNPIQAMHYMALSLGGESQPPIMEFKSDWWRLNTKRNTLQLYPGWKNLAISNLAIYQVAFIGGTRLIPQAWRMAYTAGFEDAFSEAPDLVFALGQMVAVKVLPMLAQLQDASGSVSSQSVSVDGLSQSRSYPVTAQSHRYSPLQNNLQADAQAFLQKYFNVRAGRPSFFTA